MTAFQRSVSCQCDQTCGRTLQDVRLKGTTGQLRSLAKAVLKGCAVTQSEAFQTKSTFIQSSFFFHVQICISKCQIWSRSTYSVIDADHRKGGFALLCDTFFNVWGIYLCFCFALSVTCNCSASGSVNIQAVLARSSYLFSPDQSEFIPFYNRITRY